MTRDSESGMTLVELLVAISILSIISFVLTESVIQALTTADETAGRVGKSIGAQALAAVFPTDVQSADLIEQQGSQCAGAPGTPLLGMTWTDGTVAKRATYTLETGGGPERHLVRRLCERLTTASGMAEHLVREHAVASFAAADGVDPVTVTCLPGPPCPSQPSLVTLTVTYAKDGRMPPYTFTATGSRRATASTTSTTLP